MVRHDRRRFLQGMGAAATVGLAGCSGGRSGGGGDGSSLRIVLPSGTVYYPWGKSALQQGFFEDQGIDLAIEYKPFGAYVGALPGGEIDVSLQSFVPAISQINQGSDFVNFGWAGGLQGINGMYTRADSDINAIEDLEGGTVGVFSWGSSSVQSFQGLVAEQTGLRLREDFETTTAAPPALQGLLDKGEVDAAIEVSSITIAMEARPEKYRRLAQLNELWQKVTGYNLALVAWFTRRGWLENNGDVASGLVEASVNATEYWQNNTRDILSEFGEPAAIDDGVEVDVVDRWTNQKAVFAGDVEQGYVDAAWQYLELMNSYEFIDDVPSKGEIVQST